MSKRQLLLVMYKYFLKKLGESYKKQDNDLEVITNFLLKLHLRYNLKTLDKKFFFNYLAYQFTWRSSSRSFNKYSLKNIYGITPLENYLKDEKRNELAYINDSFLRESGIKFSEIFPNSSSLKLSSIDRKRFHNTPAGLNFCLDTTTLYEKGCIECLTCKFQAKCKSIKKKLKEKG